MSLPISAVTQVVLPAPAATPSRPAERGGFGELLEKAIGRVEGTRQAADAGIERLLSGEGEEVHGAILAAQKAELSFELFLQVRNKVVQAYQEIMRMQM